MRTNSTQVKNSVGEISKIKKLDVEKKMKILIGQFFCPTFCPRLYAQTKMFIKYIALAWTCLFLNFFGNI